MNNKGQSLITFILLLPLLLALLGITIDMGFLYTESRKVNNNVKSTVLYGMENIEDINIKNKMKTMLEKNITNTSNMSIEVNKETITITLEKKKSSLYCSLVKKLNYNIKATYKGYKNNNEIKVIKG